MQDKNRDTIIDLLLSTKREGMDRLVKYLEASDFFYAPASTRYHGAYDGGLAEHSLNVYGALTFLSDNLTEGVSDEDIMLPPLDESSIIIVALLHDLCKVNTYEPDFRNQKVYSDNGSKSDPGGNFDWEVVQSYKKNPKLPMGHGSKSVFIAQQFIKLTVDEALAIHWHMGAYDISMYNSLNEKGQAYTNSLLSFLLHQADMMSTYILENENYVVID